jgi:hypothetical protein
MSIEPETTASTYDIPALRAELYRDQLTDAAMMAVLDISSWTLDRYVRAGMPHFKVGRRRLFDLQTVRGWLLSHQHQVNAPARRPGRPRGRPRKVAS